MFISLFILVLTTVFLLLSLVKFPALHIKGFVTDTFYLVTSLGAIAMLLLKVVPFNVVLSNLASNSIVNPVKILLLFITITFPCVVADELGIFKAFSTWAVNKSGGSQKSLFLCIYVLSAFLTVFTSNDIVILTLTPFICMFSKKAEINPIPYLIAEFTSANTYSMMLIIGNPTNIYLATNAGINFATYLKVMFLPTIVSGVIQLFLLLVAFKKQLSTTIRQKSENVRFFHKSLSITVLLLLAIMLLFFAISSYIGIQMQFVSFVIFLLLFLILFFYKLKEKTGLLLLKSSLKRLPWLLIPFVLSMFVIVSALEYSGVVDLFSSLLNKSSNVIFSYGISSFLLSNFLNNIPASILFSSLCNSLNGFEYFKAVFSCIIASNIGAFFTPLGALAGIMFSKLSKLYGIKMGYKDFVRYCMPISIVVLLISLFALYFLCIIKCV